MTMPFFPTYDETAIFFSMFDEEQNWCRTSVKPFSLDDRNWRTVEHYFQAMRFTDDVYREKICQSDSIEDVARLGKAWFKPKRKDWKKVRTTIMTRALYMQFQMYPDMAEALLETEERTLVENSQYDYFWGCGRDRRGENHYGKILMNIRAKIIKDAG